VVACNTVHASPGAGASALAMPGAAAIAIGEMTIVAIAMGNLRNRTLLMVEIPSGTRRLDFTVSGADVAGKTFFGPNWSAHA
jgi:hypothetical protein